MNRSGSHNDILHENRSNIFENSLRSDLGTLTRDKSPNRAKIAQLSDKFNSMHVSAQDQKMAEEKEMQMKLAQINNSIDILAKQTDKEIEGIREEAARVEDLIELEAKEKDVFMEKKQKEFKIIENSIEIEINNDKYHLTQASPGPADSKYGEKFYALKLDLAKEKKIREEQSYEMYNDVESTVVNYSKELLNEIEHLSKSRSEANEKLVKRLGQEINGFHNLLAEERKKRKNLHERLVNAIKGVQKRIFQQLSQEKQEREETQESLIKLLEDICNRFEQSQ